MIRKRKSKDGDVTHYVYVPGADGKRRYVGAFGTLKEAKQAEQENAVTQRRIKKGELPPEMDFGREVGKSLDEWLDSLKAGKSRSEASYRDRVRLYIKPDLGALPVARLSSGKILDWRERLAVRVSARTANGALACLGSAYRYFILRGWASKSPCDGVETLEEDDPPYRWIHTVDEINRLLLKCPGDLRDIVAIALGTGMRIDEILHLEWADVELDRRLITVHRGRQGTTKGGALRHVPILDSILPLLRERALRRAGARLVFPGRGGKVRTKPGVTEQYKRALKAADLDPKLRFHDLRHTMASHWVMNGGDIFRLSKILGHKSVQLTQDTYAHLAPDVWSQDYGRVTFTVPAEAAVYRFERAEGGRITGRKLVAVK